MDRTPVKSRRVPSLALLLSLLSLWVPILSSALFPDWTGADVGVLVWLLALVPGFLLSYYRGWRGASLALAAGMAAFSLAQVAILVTQAAVPNPRFLLGTVSVLTVASLGSGVVSELLHRALGRAERLALTDIGTGLSNRRHAILELEKAFAAAERGGKLSVVLFDLDHFKEINDRYGHVEGDRVLAAFADMLQGSTRAMHLAARFGGEEFIAVLRAIDAEGARVFAERVCGLLRESHLVPEPVTVSAGVAQYEAGMASPDVLVAAADQALYRAKTGGRDQVAVLAKKGRKSEELERTAVPSPDRTPMGRGELVLVVDDDVDALQSVAKSLRRFGYTVLESPSPTRAVEIARGLEDPLDLVLTDIVMPEMGGFRLVEILGEIQEDVRVIYMSGYSQEDVDWGGVPGTSYDYLGKPISIHTLARRVRHVLDQPASTRKLTPPLPPLESPVQPDEALGASTPLPPSDARTGVASRTLVIPASSDENGALASALQGVTGGPVQMVEDLSTILDGLPHLHAELLVLDLDRSREELEDVADILDKHRLSAPAVMLLVGERNGTLQERLVGLPLVDFVHKPVDGAELRARVRMLLRVRSYERWIASVEDQIRSQVVARTAELEEAREEVLRRLAWAAEYRDDLTGRHAERVGIVSGLIARELGWSPRRKAVMEKAAPLHDLGKIAVPDAVLRKTGELTSTEWAIMQRHTTIGAQLLTGSRNPILRVAEQIALTHHERWDGKGYPRGLSAESIPLEGRIVALADAYDCLTNNRPYRKSVGRVAAMEDIRRNRGSQFDPGVVTAFERVVASGSLEEALNMDMVALPDVT